MAVNPEARKQAIAHVFSRASETHDTVVPFFAHFGERVVTYAALKPGERVLDVASGTGACLIPAARAVGVEGSVTGVDISPGMVDVLRRRIAAEGITNASAEVMDAEHLTFDAGAFDAVLCAFGIMFLQDPAAALRGFHRFLAPTGRVVIAVWG